METNNCSYRSKQSPGKQKNYYLSKVAMLISVLSLYSAVLWSQQLSSYSAKQPYNFKENKGQLGNENGKASSSILYYGVDNNTSTYFMKDQISFVFSNPRSRNSENDNVVYDASRMEMHFVNASPLVTIEAQNKESLYENYYMPLCPNGAKVLSYKKLVYRNLYPHIDMNLTIKDGGLEYSFDIYPGGKPSDIQILWKGADNIVNVQEGSVNYVSGQGSLTESNLKVYQLDRKEIESHFLRNGSKVAFNIGTYDQSQVLTIDPTLIWSTYLGGDSTSKKYPPVDYSKGVAVDGSTNVYITGVNYNSNAFIATSGAYQTSYAGSVDAFIAKFSKDATTKIWATYFGGSGSDMANSIAVDRSGHLYVTGTTSSTSAIASSGAFKTFLGTGSGTTDNAFLAKFSTSGTLGWSTYFGKSGNTRGYSVAVTNSDNYVYITGETNTTDTSFATSGVYQTSNGGNGKYDAFVAKFSSGGSRTWATYYGGSFDDRGNGIALDSSDNPYITGYSYSNNNIATSGAFQTSNTANAISGMVARFSSSGSLTWGSFFHGTTFKIMPTSASGICSDNFGNIYITGTTMDSIGIATTGTYKTKNAGFQSISYVNKFTKNGKRIWGTYNGDSGTVTPYGIACDLAGNVFVTGAYNKYKWNANLATSGAHQTSYGGGVADAYLTEFSSAGARLWSTYFGGRYQDISYGVTTDAYKAVYITGYTESDKGISTAGVYQVNKVYKSDSTTVNAFVAKFGFANCAFTPGISGVKTVCLGSKATYHSIATAGSPLYHWYAKGGKVYGDSLYDSVTVTWTRLGTDSLWLHEHSGSCKDSALFLVNVIKVRANAGGATKTMCAGDSVYIGPDTAIIGAKYSWTSKPAGFTSSNSNMYVHPTASTTYYVTVSDGTGSCSAKDSIKVKVNPKPTADAGPDRRVCMGSSTILGTTATGTNKYHWTSKYTSFTSNKATPTVTPGGGGIYYLTVTDSLTGCHSTDSVVISPNKVPVIDAGDSATICAGDSVAIGPKSVLSFYSYSWMSKPSGLTSTTAKIKVAPSVTTVYYETVVDATTGCTATDSVIIRVHARPIAKFSVKDSIFCYNDTLHIIDSSIGASAHLWSFGDGSFSTSTNPVHRYSMGGSYTVKLKVKNIFGCVDSFSRTIYVDSTCVWEGDASYDSACVMNDILNIGIAYDAKGYARPFASNAWKAEPCRNWATSFKSGVNYKHADCNGDGTVDADDIKPIIKNYGKLHDKKKLSYSNISLGNSSDPSLYLSFSKDSVKVKDSLKVDINLGSSTNKAKNVYGIAFSIEYDPSLVDSTAGISVDLSKSWLGTPAKDLIFVVNNNVKDGVLDIAMSRIDHKSISGYGSIGVLGIIMVDNVAGKVFVAKKLNFKIYNIKAITNNEAIVKFYNPDASVVVYQGNAGINTAADKGTSLNVFPNPANSVLHINANEAKINEVQVIDLLGHHLIFSKNANTNQTDLNIETLSPGMYVLDVNTNKGVIRTRFIKN